MPRGANAPGARFGEFVDKVPTLAARSRGEGLMEVIHRRCSGLDVHKQTVVACVRLVLDDKITREVRTFETTTSGLQRLNELRRLRESSDAYSGAMHIQRDRLALASWLRGLAEADFDDQIVRLGRG